VVEPTASECVIQAEGEVVQLPERPAAPRDFRAFFEDDHRALLKALCFVTGDRQEAANLMQDAFLKPWGALGLDRKARSTGAGCRTDSGPDSP
jgi:hypothetical protein